MADPTAPPWPPAQRSPEELKALVEQIARHMEDYDRRACLVNWWKCEMSCAAWVKVDWLKIVEGVIGFVDLEASPQYAAGVDEGRRQLDAEIHANVFTSARLAAAEAGFGPVPESITVSYEAADPLPPKWTRPAATEAHNIRDVLAAPQRTVPPDDHWDDRPFVEWQAAAIQQVMYRAIDDAHAAGVAEGRRQATEDLTAWLDQLAARIPQYNSELSVCTRRANAQVLGAYERAATIARSGLDRNPHCSTCGDTRGGPRGHETSECTWDMWRWPDLLAVPRDAPDGQATEESTEEQRAAAVTVKGCLGVDRGHGKNDVHYWRCPTPECVGHLCRKDGLAEGAILDGRRTIEPDETVTHD